MDRWKTNKIIEAMLNSFAQLFRAQWKFVFRFPLSHDVAKLAKYPVFIFVFNSRKRRKQKWENERTRGKSNRTLNIFSSSHHTFILIPSHAQITYVACYPKPKPQLDSTLVKTCLLRLKRIPMPFSRFPCPRKRNG